MTNRRHLSYQRRAVALLGELLAWAAAENLPSDVNWTVTVLGHLYGTCLASAPAQRRADWQTWRDVLGAAPWPEYTSLGQTHLHAVVKSHPDTGNSVAILADLYEHDQDEGAAP